MEENQQPQGETPCKDQIAVLLAKAACDEKTAEYQYQIAAHIARGPGYCDVHDEFLKHADEERAHFQDILNRLEQIGAGFAFDLCDVAKKGNPWVPIQTTNVKEQLTILIKAEQDAQTFYTSIVNAARDCEDWVTNRLFKKLLADECEHETDLKRILEHLG